MCKKCLIILLKLLMTLFILDNLKKPKIKQVILSKIYYKNVVNIIFANILNFNQFILI